MSITNYTPNQGYARLSTLNYPTITVSTIDMANAARTLTVAETLGGLLLIDPNGNVTATFPTAALLVAGINGVDVGCAFRVEIINTANAADTLTLAAGTGGTLVGTATIAQSNNKAFLFRITNITSGSEAYSVYSLGTTTT